MSSSTIARWTGSRYLHPDLPTIYAVGYRAPGIEGDLAAALLYAGPGAMLSHATAAWWLDLIDRRPPMIEVSTRRRCVSLPKVMVHDRRALEAIDSVLGRGRPGSRVLRQAVKHHQPAYARTRSELENAFLGLCERHRLPIPALNVLVEGWLVDAVWFDRRVAVELDGHGGHRTRAQLERDHTRDLQLRAAGFTVVRYTWAQVTKRRTVVADLQSLLGIG